MKDKKWFLAGLLMVLISSCGYNKLVEFDERADKHWYRIEDVYNRQSDLVPMILKQFKNADKSDMKALIKAREEVADLSIVKDEIEMKKIKQYIKLQKQFTQPLDRILQDIYKEIAALPKGDSVREELKTLASQIQGSHNRIAIECEKYNKVVDEYNDYQGGITQKLTSDKMGFHHKEKLSIDMFERDFPDFEGLK